MYQCQCCVLHYMLKTGIQVTGMEREWGCPCKEREWRRYRCMERLGSVAEGSSQFGHWSVLSDVAHAVTTIVCL